MTEEKLDVTSLVSLDLVGRPFIQEQGMSLTRGVVAAFQLDESDWEVHVCNVEYFSGNQQAWLKDPDDTYGGSLTSHSSFSLDTETGIVGLSGYGVVVYIGPHSDAPWQEIRWPETDIEPIGMNIDDGRRPRKNKKQKKKSRQNNTWQNNKWTANKG